jgi:hypothetical protein
VGRGDGKGARHARHAVKCSNRSKLIRGIGSAATLGAPPDQVSELKALLDCCF